MHFSTALIAALAVATGAVADLHVYGWCADVSISAKGVEKEKENNGATQRACDMYRNRNTGNKQWDRCPDCSTSARGDVLVCNSPGNHIGGDELRHYCGKAGAKRSHGS